MKFEIDLAHFNWAQRQSLPSSSYQCGHCSNKVSSNQGYKLGHGHNGEGTQMGGIYICPHCRCPTCVDNIGNRFPDSAFGSSVRFIPEDLDALYEEARSCTSNSNYTAAVLVCRKILMHIGVEKGGEEGKSFIYYVNHLATNGYIPPNGSHWVDHIRKKGNEANHEIRIMIRDDARDLLIFIEMLLKFIYEFPNLIPQPSE